MPCSDIGRYCKRSLLCDYFGSAARIDEPYAWKVIYLLQEVKSAGVNSQGFRVGETRSYPEFFPEWQCKSITDIDDFLVCESQSLTKQSKINVGTAPTILAY